MPSIITRARRYAVEHRPSLVSLVIRAAALVASMLATYIVGHSLGPAATGYYGLVVQSALFAGTLLIAGNDVSTIQHLSHRPDLPLATSTVVRLLAPLLAGAVIAALVLLAAGPPGWRDWFAYPAGPAVLATLPLILAGRAIARLSGALLRARRRYGTGQAIEALAAPGFTVVALAAFGLPDVDRALWVTAAAAALTGLAGAAMVLQQTARSGETVTAPSLSVYRSGLPLLGASLSIAFVDWYGLAVAANTLDAGAAGQFRLAALAASVLTVVNTSIFSTFTPRIAAAAREGDTAGIRRLIASATGISAVAAVPLAAALFALARPLLALVGPAFVGGSGALRILLIGGLIAALCGPRGAALAVTGRGRLNLAYNVAGAATVALLAPWFAARWGLDGLAAAITLNLVVRNAAAYVLVARLFPKA